MRHYGSITEFMISLSLVYMYVHMYVCVCIQVCYVITMYVHRVHRVLLLLYSTQPYYYGLRCLHTSLAKTFVVG